MRKKAFARMFSLAMVLVLAFMLAACGGGGDTPASEAPAGEAPASEAPASEAPAADGDGVTLTVWLPKTFSTEADEMVQARCEEFAAGNDQVKEVKVEYVAGTDGYSKWNAAIESKSGPDLTFLHMSAYISYVDMGVLLDITDVINDIETNYSPLIPAAKDNIEIDGSIYTLPLYAQVNMLTYRSDMLGDAGYDSAPATWQEMRDVAKAVSKPDESIYGLGIGMATADDGEDTLTALFRAFGAYFWDEEGNVTINSPETVNAINFVVDMYNNDKSMPPSVVEWDPSGNNKSYLAGESAMVFNPPTLYNSTFADDLKDTLGAVTEMSPYPKGDFETWSTQNYITFSAFNFTENPELSKELLKFLLDETWYESYMELNFPVAGPVFEKTTEGEVWQSDNGLKLVDAARNQGRHYAYPCKDLKVMAADARAYNDFVISKTLQKVILNGMSPEDAAAELETMLQDHLAAVQ